jgi:hypothetical protein
MPLKKRPLSKRPNKGEPFPFRRCMHTMPIDEPRVTIAQEDDMEEPILEEQLRTLAYQLWEQAGRPDGRSDEFWQQAQHELGVQTNGLADEATTDAKGLPSNLPLPK